MFSCVRLEANNDGAHKLKNWHTLVNTKLQYAVLLGEHVVPCDNNKSMLQHVVQACYIGCVEAVVRTGVYYGKNNLYTGIR